MYKLTNYITDINSYNRIAELDQEIFMEKLQEPHLIELFKWSKENKKAWKNDDSYTARRYSMTLNELLKKFPVDWNKITEEDFDYFSKGSKAGTKLARTMLDNYDKLFIMFLDSNHEDKVVKILTGHGSFDIKRNKVISEWDSKLQDYVEKRGDEFDRICDLLKKDISDYCSDYDFMILDYTNLKEEVLKKKRDRHDSRRGMIENNSYEYNEIARKNRERYKKIINQIKAKRNAENDTVSQDVKEIMDSVLELTSTIVKDSKKYASLEYKIGELLKQTHDKKQYSNNGRHGGYYYGVDGLLYLYQSYVTNNLSASKGETWASDGSKYKKLIVERIAVIKNKIEELKKEMKEIDEKSN